MRGVLFYRHDGQPRRCELSAWSLGCQSRMDMFNSHVRAGLHGVSLWTEAKDEMRGPKLAVLLANPGGAFYAPLHKNNASRTRQRMKKITDITDSLCHVYSPWPGFDYCDADLLGVFADKQDEWQFGWGVEARRAAFMLREIQR